MNESDQSANLPVGHICANCEFWEKHRDRANLGDCLLDIHGDHGIKTAKATDVCEFFMGSTVED